MNYLDLNISQESYVHVFMQCQASVHHIYFDSFIFRLIICQL